MKIESGRRVGPSSASRRAGQAAPGFAPAEADAPQRVAGPTGVGAVASIDTILALQADEPPAQRRARQARRGSSALDALERLERALLDGRAPAALRAELESLRHASALTGDSGLDGVLLEIDTRLAVEAAKLERLLGSS